MFCPSIFTTPFLSILRLIIALTLFVIKIRFLGNVRLKRLPMFSNFIDESLENHNIRRKRKNSVEDQNLIINSIFYVFIRMKCLGKLAIRISKEAEKRENLCLGAIFMCGFLLDIEIKLKLFCFGFLIIAPLLKMSKRYLIITSN